MLSFLSPLFLVGALAAAIPVILHFLRREPEARVKFAAVRLLKQGPVEHTQKRLLRDLLLLALRVIALVLLSLAFARPFLASAEHQSSSVTVIALDTSLSMSSPGRFDRAKALARDAVRGAAAADRIAVVTFSSRAHVASAVSDDRTLAVAAIDAARTEFAATRYRAALRTAASLLEGAVSTIVVVTDLQAHGWDTGDEVALPASARIEVSDVGEPPPNLMVSAVRAERDELVATVRNLGPAFRDARVEVRARRGAAGDRAEFERVGSAAVSVAGNQSVDVRLPAPRNTAVAAVQIADPGGIDGIDGDNIRYVVLDGNSRSAVLVVTPTGDLSRDAFYLQQALAAGDALYALDGVGAALMGGWDADRLGRYAAVVLSSTRGLDRHGRDLVKAYVADGGGLFVAASADVDGDVIADVVGGVGIVNATGPAGRVSARTLAPVDARHPIFGTLGEQGPTLALVSFRQIAAIRGDACQSLARFTTGEVALLDCPQGLGRVLILASDLDNRWNDFPLRATFVPFLHETLRYLSGTKSRQSEYIVGGQPAGVGPGPGVTRVPASRDGPARWVVVNVDPTESDPARMSLPEFQAAVGQLQRATPPDGAAAPPEVRRQEERQRAWQYLLALVVLALVAESYVASRTA